jgi:hypothetical protein
MRHLSAVIVACILASSAEATDFLFAQPNASAPAQISLSVDTSVKIANTTPGGSIVLFSCARTSLQGRTHVTRDVLTLLDENGDGVIEFTPKQRIPLRSVWVAIDSLSGALAIGAPAPFPFTVTKIATDAFKKDTDGRIARLEQDLRRLLYVLVRPGYGAWMSAASDGDERDADQSRNAKVALSFGAARPVRGSPAAPSRLKPGDVVVAIDPSHLDVYVGRIEE